MSDLKSIFNMLKDLLEKNSKGLDARTVTIGSKAKPQKLAFHLYGEKEVRILNRKPQQTYIVGIIMQKHFIGFYSMPVYSHPKEFTITHPVLKKSPKGKSCFNISRLDDNMIRELDDIIKKSIQLYKKEGWV